MNALSQTYGGTDETDHPVIASAAIQGPPTAASAFGAA